MPWSFVERSNINLDCNKQLHCKFCILKIVSGSFYTDSFPKISEDLHKLDIYGNEHLIFLQKCKIFFGENIKRFILYCPLLKLLLIVFQFNALEEMCIYIWIVAVEFLSLKKQVDGFCKIIISLVQKIPISFWAAIKR